jgi:hypothetical protein
LHDGRCRKAAAAVITRLSRLEIIKRAEALLERRTVRAPPPVLNRWWSAASEAELEAFRAGGPLPTSEEALEMLAIDIELDELV